MKKVELVFIPSPGLSHLVSTVESAKLLLDCDRRLSITVLIMKLSADQTVEKYAQSVISSSSSDTTSRLRFVDLPGPDETQSTPSNAIPFASINGYAGHVREIVSDLIKKTSEPGSQLAGLVLDMFCTNFADIADEFGIPSYVFFTSNASALGLIFHLLSTKYLETDFKTSIGEELSVPCFSSPVPPKAVPAPFVDEGPLGTMLRSFFKRIPETKGVMVNSFQELESFAVRSLLSSVGQFPKVYPVGPILNQTDSKTPEDAGNDIKTWLDEQPKSSVVFLCFGTMGSFEPVQVKEIATALENSGKRFLWSLRKPGEKGKAMLQRPTEYEDYRGVLPEGFLERTKGTGKVTGWADQVGVLSHSAVGGFVSHCGWNSTLESVWYGVPVATFPLYAEQQLNAFLLVKELGMAEPIRIDYHMDYKGDAPSEIVGAEEIEAAINRLMEEGSGVRRKVKEMQRKSREALMEGGSSYKAQKAFIEDVIANIS